MPSFETPINIYQQMWRNIVEDVDVVLVGSGAAMVKGD
jgi:hypothetical protein